MTIKELLKQIETIHHERTLSAHHDDMFFQTYADVEALERVIKMIKFLTDKSPAHQLTVAEILAASNVVAE
ncbi:MAG: hypothetical protein IJS69_05260 [Selenomonadaceae bacterium]|nr:hypothetical protein [Selenomonadaceae bacterium]